MKETLVFDSLYWPVVGLYFLFFGHAFLVIFPIAQSNKSFRSCFQTGSNFSFCILYMDVSQVLDYQPNRYLNTDQIMI